MSTVSDRQSRGGQGTAGGQRWRVLAALGLALTLAGCSSGAPVAPVLQFSPAQTGIPEAALIVPPAPVPVPVPQAAPPPAKPKASVQSERRDAIAKVGKPYQVNGTWYYPSHDPSYDTVGEASWYGPDFNGQRTANGEVYNMRRLSAAHPTLPMPCYVTVTNLANGRTIVVRVNDRGPYKRGRIIDLSQRAAKLLDYTGTGTARVRVRYLKKAPVYGDDTYEEQFLASQPWYNPEVAMSLSKGWDPVATATTTRVKAPATAAGGDWLPDVSR